MPASRGNPPQPCVLPDRAAVAAPRGAHAIHEPLATRSRQAEEVDLAAKLRDRPVTGDVPVDARRCGTLPKRALVSAKHRLELGGQRAVVPQMVLLVVLLGRPEAIQRFDPRGEPSHARAGGEAGGALLGDGMLLVVVREEERSVLNLVRTPRGVMRCKRKINQFAIADHRGIEVDLKALGLVAEIAIRRIGVAAACVADTRLPDSFEQPKLGVRCPESTDAERGSVKPFGGKRVKRRSERTRTRVAMRIEQVVHAQRSSRNRCGGARRAPVCARAETNPLSGGCGFEICDDELLHAEHHFSDAPRRLGIRFREKTGQRRRRDLP